MSYWHRGNARLEIAPLLPDPVKSVLEIGCGVGNTLEWLRDSIGVKRCVGVEINALAASRARDKGISTQHANVEKEALQFEGEQFDLLLCLDVLEHLTDPWRTLKLLVAHLKPGGCLIASIPNVAHVSVLLPLILHNKWTYEDSGILDRTHLRFFTRDSAVELLELSGLKITRILPHFGRRTHRRLNVLSGGLLERFLTLQFLISARKS